MPTIPEQIPEGLTSTPKERKSTNKSSHLCRARKNVRGEGSVSHTVDQRQAPGIAYLPTKEHTRASGMADTVFFTATPLLTILSYVAPLEWKATGSQGTLNQPQAPCPSPQWESCKFCLTLEAVKPRPKWPVGQQNSLRLPSHPLLPQPYPLFVWSRKHTDLFSILIPPALSLPNLLLLLLFSFLVCPHLRTWANHKFYQDGRNKIRFTWPYKALNKVEQDVTPTAHTEAPHLVPLS